MTAGKTVHVPTEAKRWPVQRSWTQLDDLCDGIFDCPHSTPVLTTDGPLVVRTQDVRTGVFRADQAAHVSEETYRDRIARAEPRHGDILYSREGTYFGIAAEVPEHTRVCLGQRMVLIRPNKAKLYPRFVRLWLNSPTLSGHIHGFRDGTVAERLNMPTIRALPIPIFELREQERIASALCALDDKIELNRQNNRTLEALARATFKDWIVERGPTYAKIEARPPYLGRDVWSLFPDGLNDDENPVGWETSAIGREVDVVGGSTPSTKEPSYWGGDFCWATPMDLSALEAPVLLETERRITTGGLEQISSGLLPLGTVLLSSRAPIGYVAIAQVPTAVNQGFIAMVCQKRLSNVFVWLWTHENMDAILQNANGSTFQEISKANFRPIPVTVPSEPVRTALDAVARPLFDRIVSNENESHALAHIRDLLLPKLISGEVHIRDTEKLVEEAV